MSADLLENVIDPDGCEISLDMKASCIATLSLSESDFILYPDKKGLDNAKKIASALIAWTEHVTTLKI